MNKKAFKTYMQQGRGACALVLQGEKNIEKYKDIVLWGCLHNLSYDTQCEGVRAESVYHLTTFFCDEAYFVTPIIKAFTSLANEKDDLFQHFYKLLSLVNITFNIIHPIIGFVNSLRYAEYAL